MKVSSICLVFVLLPFLTSCTGPQRTYRDPLTYSFEGEAPSGSPNTEWHDVKGKVEETSKKIRTWEGRHLW